MLRSMRFLRLAALTLAATTPLASTATAQPRPDVGSVGSTPVTIGIRTSLRSLALKETRPILIHLPASYATAPNARYPVLYVLDGDAYFASTCATVDFLARNDRMPAMIVVGIPNTGDRTHDLTPPARVTSAAFETRAGGADSARTEFPTAGGAESMRRFLTTELAPWIEREYRAAPYRVLVGHSFGGLFAIDALADAPRTFDAYVAISPSLWWDRGAYVARIARVLANAPLAGASLYMTTGAREGAEMIEPARQLAAALDSTRHAGFRSWYVVMPTETHNSNPMRSTYDALEHIFAGWEAPDSAITAVESEGDLAALDAHYAALSQRFGFVVQAEPDVLHAAAAINLEQKRVDAAVSLLHREIDARPEWPSAWDALAGALEAKGDLRGALSASDRAVKLGSTLKDPLLGQYVVRRNRLKALRR